MKIPESDQSIVEKIERLKKEISEIAQGLGHPIPQLVLVTKTIPVPRIKEALEAGVADFGENRVQELLEKMPEFSEKIRWHMIGRLQTNKVKAIVGRVHLIHSLDRVELLEEIERQAQLKKIDFVDCLIQVNSSKEASKAGFMPNQVEGFMTSLKEAPHVRIKGLMTIGPLSEDREVIRRVFKETRDLFEKLKRKFPKIDWNFLSMGMSGDYDLAIEEGSTMVRVGSAVFGVRTRDIN